MKKHVLTGLAIASTLGFLTPITSHAFGLGKIEVKSALNEPFKAEIPVTALQPGEKDNLEIRLAPQKEFDKAGLYRSFILSDLTFEIVTKNAQTVVVLTTNDAVKEPFLDFLITATSGSGLMVREYTVLLDPPEYVTAALSSSSAEVESAPTTAAPTSTPSSEPKTTQYRYAAESTAPVTSYKVQKNDTLWNVAQATKPSDVISVHQMMMALYDANPDAFNRQNVNGLKAGVTLSIPSESAITSRTKSEAISAFNEQNTAWKNRNKPASVAEPAPVEVVQDKTPAIDTSMADEPTEPTVSDTTTAVEQAADMESRLNLVAPDEASSVDDAAPNTQGDEDLNVLSQQLTLAQETIEAQAQENIDLKARLDLMEEQLETLQRLISVDDPELAQLQDMLTEQQAEVDAMAAEIAGVERSEDVTETAAEADVTAETKETEAVTFEAEPDSPATLEQTDATPETAANDSEPAVDNMVAQAADLLNMDEQEVASTVEEVKAFIAENKIPVVGGLLFLLILLMLLIRRSKRERTWDDAVQEMGEEDASETAPVVGAIVAEEDEDEEVLIEEKSVAELVEQADMFIGYADYVQAKYALDQARAIDDEDTMVAHKLLFVLYKQEQTDAFISLVEEVDFDKDSFEWTEISKWGAELAPQHPLFAAPVAPKLEPEPVEDVVAEESEDTAPESALVLDSPDIEPIEPVATAESETVETVTDTGPVAFDLTSTDDDTTDEPEVAEEELGELESTPEAGLEDDLLSFNLDSDLNETTETVEEASTTPEVLDLDVESLDVPELDIETDAEALEVPSLDMDTSTDDALAIDDEDVAELELDVDEVEDMDFEIEDIDDIDEAETKLDLASAYIEMGDPEGARSILNEVLVDGSDEQKQRAEALLQNLS